MTQAPTTEAEGRALTLLTIREEYAAALAPLLSGQFDPDNPDEAAAFDLALDTFEAAQIKLRDKAQAYAKVIRDFEGDQVKCDREIAFYEMVKARRQQHVDFLKARLLAAMKEAGMDRFEGGLHTIRIQTNPPKCEVVDESLVPEGFLRLIPEKVIPARFEVNKVAINTAFKESGEIPPGVTVTRGEKLVIS